MTNLEALKATLGEYQANDSSLSKALIDQQLTESSTYTVDNKEAVDLAAIDVLNGILYSSVSEGGYSVTYNTDSIKTRIAALGGAPKVRGVNCW